MGDRDYGIVVGGIDTAGTKTGSVIGQITSKMIGIARKRQESSSSLISADWSEIRTLQYPL